MAKNIKNKKQVHYDRASDVLYLGMQKGAEEEFVEIAPGVSVELDACGKVIGVEVMNASRVLRPFRKSLGERLVAVND